MLRVRIVVLLVTASLCFWARSTPDQKQAEIIVYHGDNLPLLKEMPSESVNLIYIDPPFNTGRRQQRRRIKTINGRNVLVPSYGYDDTFDDYIAFLRPRMIEAHRILKPTGSLFFHIDYREVHYCKVMLDQIFGRQSFMNEIIWAYDYGGKSKTKWSAKHDNILWYAKNPKAYTFNFDEVDRIPYMAPSLVSPEKAARGKIVTDVWWHTIVSPTGKEKTGYATQKPRGIIDRIVKVHSNPGDVLMDFFAGSGTFGESAHVFGRRAILIDCCEDAINVMKIRFSSINVKWMSSLDTPSQRKLGFCEIVGGTVDDAPVRECGLESGKKGEASCHRCQD